MNKLEVVFEFRFNGFVYSFGIGDGVTLFVEKQQYKDTFHTLIWEKVIDPNVIKDAATFFNNNLNGWRTILLNGAKVE